MEVDRNQRSFTHFLESAIHENENLRPRGAV